MNPTHHIRKIVGLSEIYGPEPVVRAMRDAFTFQAFSCEYIANLLEQRTRKLPEPSALKLTRGEDLLDLSIEQPSFSREPFHHFYIALLLLHDLGPLIAFSD